jgi:hypothetical protein
MVDIAVALANGSSMSFSVVTSVDNSQMHHVVRDEELKMEEAARSGDVAAYLKASQRRALAKRLGGKKTRRVWPKYIKKSKESYSNRV